MSEEVFVVLDNKDILFDNCENMEELYDKFYYPLLVEYSEIKKQKDKEIDRLNNIINEIQDMCREEYYKKNTTDIDSIGLSNNIWVMIYMKIKENNKNE